MNSLAPFVHRSFDDLRQVHDNVEFWSARELQKILAYRSWKEMKTLIDKVRQTIINVGENPEHHILSVDKTTHTASGTKRTYRNHDYLLTRYASYLMVQSADSDKKSVSALQSYIAKSLVGLTKQQQSVYDTQRKEAREEIIAQNKRLFSAAKKHGVKDFSGFNNAGYMGLYGMRHNALVKYKGVGRKQLLDRASLVELFANLSRISQTRDSIIAKNTEGQDAAERIHFTIGRSIRDSMKESYGVFPEDLPSQESVKRMK